MRNRTQHSLSEVESKTIGRTISNNELMIEERAGCADKKSKKKCQILKKKNNGKGCKKKSTQKNCKKTCGLCPDGKLSLLVNYCIL